MSNLSFRLVAASSSGVHTGLSTQPTFECGGNDTLFLAQLQREKARIFEAAEAEIEKQNSKLRPKMKTPLVHTLIREMISQRWFSHYSNAIPFETFKRAQDVLGIS